MASNTKYSDRLCKALIGCDGEATLSKDGVCQRCKARVARMDREKKEYARISKLVAEAERNGRRFAQEAR